MTVLSDNEKASIVIQKIKILETQKYSQEMALVEFNVLPDENESNILFTNNEIEKINLKIAALQTELNSLNVSEDFIQTYESAYSTYGSFTNIQNLNTNRITE